MGKKQKTTAAQKAPASETKEDLHKLMMEQLGLKVDSKEAQSLMKDLKKGKKASASEAQENDGGDDAMVGGDDGKLTLGDLFSSIGVKKNEDDVINTNRLEKQIKQLRKEAQTTALTTPISGRKRL